MLGGCGERPYKIGVEKMKKARAKTGAAGVACGVNGGADRGAVAVDWVAARAAASLAFDTWCESGENFHELTAAAALADVRGDVCERVPAAASCDSSYELAARAFLVATAARFSARYLGAFDSVEEWGENGTGAARCGARGLLPVWRVRIATAAGSMVVRFRGSLNDGRRGVTLCGVYDVLACLTRGDVGSFDNFASDFGYFPLSSAAAFLHAWRVWRGCLREFAGVCRVWGESDRARLVSIN